MDQHLTYVAMTRDRDEVSLHVGCDKFRNVVDLWLRLSQGEGKHAGL